MTLPQGPFGTNADVLVDIVVVALVIIVPILAWSFRQVRAGRFAVHRNTQTALTAFLVVVVLLFEADIQAQGGIHKMAGDSAITATPFFDVWFQVHLALAGSTALLWLGLVGWSWSVMPRPPRPSAYSRVHRIAGWIGAVGMVLTGLTGIGIYLMAFVL